MEQQTIHWLRTRNLPKPVLRLLVAGSRHLDGNKGFINRYLVLGPGGDPIWEQEKHTSFTLSGNETLQEIQAGCSADKAFEPLQLGSRIAVIQTGAGRILGPICLDFIDAPLWADLGADLYLVPAMSAGLSRFHNQAKILGNRYQAATIVCNADTGSRRDRRIVTYLPTRDKDPPKAQQIAPNLFTFDIKIV
jgi:hypothetical protein